MQIEIDDKLVERLKRLREQFKNKSPVKFDTVGGEINALIGWALERDEEVDKEIRELMERKQGLKPIQKDHNCTEHIAYSGEYKFVGDAVLFYGKCSVCGKELVHTFYGEKNARETDEGFIHADQWRELTASDIISSVDIGLSVLEGKEFSKEYHRLLVLVEEIANMLAREV